MHALILLCINPHTTYEMPRYTCSKDMIGDKNESRDPDHTHYRAVCHIT